MLQLLMSVVPLSLLLFHCSPKKKDSPEPVQTLKSQKLLPVERKSVIRPAAAPPEPTKSRVEGVKTVQKNLEQTKTTTKNKVVEDEKKSKKSEKDETEGPSTLLQQQTTGDVKKIDDGMYESMGGAVSAEKKSKKAEPSQQSFKYEPPPMDQRPKKPLSYEEMDPQVKSTRSLELVKDEPGFE